MRTSENAGDQQLAVLCDSIKVYAPVLEWKPICILLAVLGWAEKQSVKTEFVFIVMSQQRAARGRSIKPCWQHKSNQIKMLQVVQMVQMAALYAASMDSSCKGKVGRQGDWLPYPRPPRDKEISRRFVD